MVGSNEKVPSIVKVLSYSGDDMFKTASMEAKDAFPDGLNSVIIAASWLSKSWQNSIHPNLVKGTGLANLGKRKQEVAILSGYLPSTLLEVCFINNSYEMNQYQYRMDFIAKQIAFGIASR